MMNRTQMLLAAVSSSLLLTGTVLAKGTEPPRQSNAAAQQDDSWKTDPQVEKAANDIFTFLVKTTRRSAKSQVDIAKQFPQFQSNLIARSLMKLWYRGDIRRTGDGTQDSPYRYFDRITDED